MRSSKKIARGHVLLPAVVAGLVLVLALMSFLAGCGGDDTADETTTTAAPAAPAPGDETTTTEANGEATGEPLTIGVALPYSGVYAVLGESITNGMELYFEEIGNQVAGREIVLIEEDTEANPEVGIRRVRKLVEQDNVDILSGFVSTAVLYAARDYIHDNQVVTVVSNAGGNELSGARQSDYIFRASFSSWQISNPMGQWVAENVSTNVFTAAADYGFGRESIANFLESFTEAGGNQVGEVWSELGTNDYSAVLTQIRQANPEAVYTFFSGSDAVNFVRQFDEFGLKDQGIRLTGAGFTFTDDVLPAQGEAAVGGIGGLHWTVDLDNPENEAFKQAYEEKFGELPDVYAMQGYDAARVIAEAVEATGGDTEDKDALADAMRQVSFASPRGEFGLDPQTHNVIQNVYVFEVQEVDGEPRAVVIDEIGEVTDPGAQ
jgi:branched-chain amino acid transport system substrate-binding protein